jgi:hypothetical protein
LAGCEVREHGDEHEDVVDGQRFLDDVTREELERGIAGQRAVVEAGEGRHLRQVPQHVAVEEVIEDECEQHPHHAPSGGFARGDFVRVAVKYAQVERKHEQNERREACVEPPVVGERKQQQVGHGGAQLSGKWGAGCAARRLQPIIYE